MTEDDSPDIEIGHLLQAAQVPIPPDPDALVRMEERARRELRLALAEPGPDVVVPLSPDTTSRGRPTFRAGLAVAAAAVLVVVAFGIARVSEPEPELVVANTTPTNRLVACADFRQSMSSYDWVSLPDQADALDPAMLAQLDSALRRLANQLGGAAVDPLRAAADEASRADPDSGRLANALIAAQQAADAEAGSPCLGQLRVRVDGG